MGLDVVVSHGCAVKAELGFRGDPLLGTEVLLDRLKARVRADIVAEQARVEGRHPGEISVRAVLMGPDGPVEQVQSWFELEDLARVLDPHEAACEGCVARCTPLPFGCVGYLSYPVSVGAEKWLLDRVPPPSSEGGSRLARALPSLDPEAMDAWRARGLLAPLASLRVWHGTVVLCSDQLLQALLCVGNRLDPAHCLELLLWLDALEIDGCAPTAAALRALEQTGPDARSQRGTLRLGPEPEDPSARELRALLVHLHRAWCLDVALLVAG